MADWLHPSMRRKKPLKRSTKSIARRKAPRKVSVKRAATGGRDPASFRDSDVEAVYPDPACFHTARRPSPTVRLERHHIVGRGGKDPDDRLIHSSIFNMAILEQPIHKGPLRDHATQRQVYLELAFTNGMRAVGQGRYVLKDLDRAFLSRYGLDTLLQ